MEGPRRLGSRYTLAEPLGQGASGQVWAGADDEGRTVAIKVLKEELAGDQGIVNRFVQERTLLSSIRHPNVVGVQDLVVEGGTLGIVMEYVPGGDLRSLLRERGALPPAEIARVGREVCSALAAAHERGVVHRDVKPENVLIDAHGVARLTDFGIAKLVDGSTRSTMLLGTPQYMAPEIAEGHDPTPAADLYSMGVMLYELACGVPPFAGRGNAMATLRAHGFDLPGRPDGMPDELWETVDRLLSKDPSQRQESAKGLADGLGAGERAWAELPAAPHLTSPPPIRGRIDVSPAGNDAGTFLGKTSLPGWMAQHNDPRSAGLASPNPWVSGPRGAYHGGEYHPRGYGPGENQTGANGASPYAYAAPAPRRSRAERVLLGAALAVLLLGFGGYAVAKPDAIGHLMGGSSATPAPTMTVTQSAAPAASQAQTPTQQTPAQQAPAQQAPAQQAPAPQVQNSAQAPSPDSESSSAAAPVSVTVTDTGQLGVGDQGYVSERSRPSGSSKELDRRLEGSQVSVVCQTSGGRVHSTRVGRPASTAWAKTTNGGWVAGYYLSGIDSVPQC